MDKNQILSNHSLIPSEVSSEESQLIENQLKVILASKYFKSAKQMQRFLKYIVEKTIDGKGEAIKQYSIAVDALLFTNDFDPDENPAVRIMGGRVRQRLIDYYKVHKNEDEIIISIPKGGYIPEFKKNPNAQNDREANLNISQGPTLALVSFTDKSQSKNTNQLLLKSTDTFATELSRSLCLKLVVYNPFANKEQSHLIEVEMKSTRRAEYILSLFLQKIDGEAKQYRLIYKLILVDTGEILWSDNYVISDNPIDEPDYIIGKVIAMFADHLQGMMHTHWSRQLLSNKDTIPEYHQVLAYFRNYTDHLDKDTFITGVSSCLEAINRNPNDVIANMLYATYCRHEHVFNLGVIESPLEKGIKCIEAAIRLLPNSHEVHYLHGTILFCLKEWEYCVEKFELARRISKHNIVIEHGVGFRLCMMDQWDKGLPLVTKAMLLSRLYPSHYHMVPFLNFYRQEKYQEALYEAKKITTVGFMYGQLARCISYAQLGLMAEAEKEFLEILQRYPHFMDTGKIHLSRYIGSENLTEKIWDGVLKVIK